MSEYEQEPEYLEVDNPVPGQSFVCLSFVSPEKVFPRKEAFFAKHFVKFVLKKYHLDQVHGGATPIFRDDFDVSTLDKINFNETYDDFLYAQEQELTAKFAEENNHITSVRALKIRGSYETRQEAEYRAKQLQRRDPKFHVFVGQVGYWLPWDPNPDFIKDQEYMNEQLNTLMKKYQQQREYKDDAFIQDTEARKAKALSEATRVRNEQIAERNAMEAAGQSVPSGKHVDSEETAKENIAKLREIAQRKDYLMNKSRNLDVSAKLRALAMGEQEPVAANENNAQEAVVEEKKSEKDAMGDDSEHSDPWMRSRLERARLAEKKSEQTNDETAKMTPDEMETARRKQIRNISKSLF